MNILNIVLSAIITSIGLYFTIKNFLNRKFNIKSFVICTIMMSILFIISKIFFDNTAKLIVIIIFEIFTLYFSFSYRNISEAVYYSLVYEILAFIVEILISIVYVLILNYNINNYNHFSLSLLIFSILNSILILLISKIKPFTKFINKFYNVISKKISRFLYIFLIFLLLLLLLVFNKTNLENDLSFYINISMVIFVFITLIYIIYKNLKNDRLENNYNEMMEYVQKYEKIINEQGKKNHEYNNQLTVIRGYSHNPKKLEEYLDTIIEDHKCGQNYTIRQLSNFPDGGIKGLIYHKLSKMEDNKIKYYLYIDGESKNIFEKNFDLKTYQDITKLLGIFLDNAIDASKEAKEKEIEIDIKNEDNSIIITISNTFNSNVDTKQIGKKGFTTKGRGHGYGLSIVKDINKHNENIETFNDIEDDKFTQTILIYYK